MKIFFSAHLQTRELFLILFLSLSQAENGGAASFSAALIKYIASTSGNFKISNNNILKATIQTCTALVKQSNPALNNAGGKFSRAAGWELLKNLGDKLSDKKNKDVVQGLLTGVYV